MKYLLFPILSLFLLSCSEQEKKELLSCEDFKSGEFTYGRKYEFEGKQLELPKAMNLDTVRFIRKDGIHTEFYHEENKYAVYDIRWKNDCSYDMKLLSSTIDIYEPGDIITTKIISRTDSSYAFISKSKHGEVTGTIIQLKK